MECPDISMLRFSRSSETAIEQIKQVQSAGNLLASALAGSALLKIFTGHRVQVQGSAHNIIQKDWDLWAQAMRAVPLSVNRRILNIASMQLLNPNPADERQFWEAVVYGCH